VVTLLTIPLGAAVGVGLSSVRRRTFAVLALLAAITVLAAGSVAGTAYLASRATTGNPVWSLATLLLPATVDARPIASLRMRDGRDLGEGADLLLVGENDGEFVVYDSRSRRTFGVPRDEFLVIQYERRGGT
jgi:hypothetical protein